MLDYTSTSRIRRKVKTKLARIGEKIEVELAASLHDIVKAEKDKRRLREGLKSMMMSKNSTDSNKSYESLIVYTKSR